MTKALCAWCERPAIDTIEVEPAQRRIVKKLSPYTGMATFAPEIADVREDEGGPIRDPRRTHAVGVAQLDIFGGETISGTLKRRNTSAIGGA